MEEIQALPPPETGGIRLKALPSTKPYTPLSYRKQVIILILLPAKRPYEHFPYSPNFEGVCLSPSSTQSLSISY